MFMISGVRPTGRDSLVTSYFGILFFIRRFCIWLITEISGAATELLIVDWKCGVYLRILWNKNSPIYTAIVITNQGFWLCISDWQRTKRVRRRAFIIAYALESYKCVWQIHGATTSPRGNSWVFGRVKTLGSARWRMGLTPRAMDGMCVRFYVATTSQAASLGIIQNEHHMLGTAFNLDSSHYDR